MISKKRAPRVSDTELNRVVNQIYDDINEVIESVNKSVGESSSNASGKRGDLQLVFDKTDKKYYAEGRFETGWARVELTLTTPN